MPDRNTASPRAWQRMLSGRRLDLLSPSPLDIEIEDIAHGLARVARWNGQTTGENGYSVAQHSLNVLDIFDRITPRANAADRMVVLLHDGPEYVIGDMISPFKVVLGPEYKTVEARLQEAVHLRFGLPAKTQEGLKALIKRADIISAFFEAVLVAGFSEAEAADLFGRPRNVTRDVSDFEPWSVTEAKSRYLQRFQVLESELGQIDSTSGDRL